MENRSDIEKRLGEKLEAAYMLEEIPQGMSREDFHRLIQAAEKKKKRRRNMLSLAAACVALCLVCGGFVAGMTLGESATAGKDGEKKTVQQGDSVVIGSGASENNQNVGVSTKTYTDIEDIPEDVRKGIHFLDSDEFFFSKMIITKSNTVAIYTIIYCDNDGNKITVVEESKDAQTEKVMAHIDDIYDFRDGKIYEKSSDAGILCVYCNDKIVISITIPKEVTNKKEAILNGLV